MISAINSAAAAGSQGVTKSGFAALGMDDFIHLLTAELAQQDPTAPTDNKDMLAQMAQFSSLSGIDSMNAKLGSIADKLDALIAAQMPAT
jgi:flagellar basal-body rod modification protein FlgD